jgi:hypothetical protein
MGLFGILGLIIIIATGVSSGYYYTKALNIAMKYLTWKDIIFHPFGIKKKMPEPEWKQMKKDQWNAFRCILCGIGIFILLGVLDYLSYENRKFSGETSRSPATSETLSSLRSIQK